MVNAGGLPSRPRVPKYFHIVPMSDNQLQLRSAHKTVVLSGKSIKAVGRLLELLDGTHELREIIECFPDFPEEDVIAALKRLFDRGLIEDASQFEVTVEGTQGYEAQITFFSITHGDGRVAQDLLRQARVVVFGLGKIGSHAVASLARAGVGYIVGVDAAKVDSSLPICSGLYRPVDVGRQRCEVAQERLVEMSPNTIFKAFPVKAKDISQIAGLIGESSLVLVCEDSPAVDIYRLVNQAALEQGIRWLRASLEGFEAQLGPCVIPYETACHTCYELRVKGNWTNYDENLAFEKYLSSGQQTGDYGCLAPISGFLGNLAALETLKFLTGFSNPMTSGRAWTFNINTFEAESHEVLKLPRCPACGITRIIPSPALWVL